MLKQGRPEAWYCRLPYDIISIRTRPFQPLPTFKKLKEAICVDCKSPIDDTEHAIFHCNRWWSPRRALEVDIVRPFEQKILVDAIIQNKDIWRAVKKFMDMVMTKRKEEERIRQQKEGPV